MNAAGKFFGRSTLELQEAVSFLDCDGLRGHYVGYLAELRAEIKRRGNGDRESCAGDGCCTNPRCKRHGVPPWNGGAR